MSINNNKVEFSPDPKRRKGLIWFLASIEIMLTVMLGLVIATTKLFTPSADSARGIVNALSYQGRLTDTSGNALGGSGTNYCFRFSIYDESSSGNKVWPTDTPATTTLSVVSGVFNADIGSADALTYDFYPTSTTYLNVEVNSTATTCTGTWETLTPRQQILATGYAIAAENVYGDLLRTDVASSIVQIGTGAGVSSSSVKKLALDVANTNEVIGTACTTNGTLWYNSSAANTQALACIDGKIRAVVPDIVNGYFASYFSGEHLAAQIGQSSLFIQPMEVAAAFQYDNFVLPIVYTATSNLSGSATLSLYAGLYTRTGATLSLASSQSQSYGITNSGTVGNYSLNAGKRNYPMAWTNTVPAGKYFLAILSRTTSGGAAGMTWSNFVASNANSIYSGKFSQANNATNQFILGLGSYSAQTANLPASVAFSEIRGSAALNLRPPLYYFVSST